MAKKRGNNEGSIYRRKNGTWAAQYTVWTAEGRKRRSVAGKTRAEVSRKLMEAMADRDGGLLHDAGKLTLDAYLDRWLADSVKGTVKETTYANYAYVTHKHISPALGRVKLKTLTPAHVRGFYGEKARTNLSATTVKKMHVVLRKALSQAVSDGLIPRNAADGVKPPRVGAPGEEIKPLAAPKSAPSSWRPHAERGLRPCTCWRSIAVCVKASCWPCVGKTCTSKPPDQPCSCGARSHAERAGAGGSWARAPSPARADACA
jgi:hypothetical protein